MIGPRIGLLGGSFNPAHEGHRHISLFALQRLRLDAVWWLVSPQNPLKPVEGMASIDERIASAESVARHPRIEVSDIESRMGTRYTADTLQALRRRYAKHRFVWIMGGDGLADLHRWHRWQDVARDVPIAVVARSGARARALLSPAARWMAPFRLPERQAGQLPLRTAPAWSFLSAPLSALSSTALRAQNQTKGTDEQISSELR